MQNQNQFNSFKQHIKERYDNLVEKSNDYRFEDESISDLAAFKAMKLLKKLNQISYLDRKFTL